MAGDGWMEKRLRMLAQVLEEKNLQEIEISLWGLRFRVARDRAYGGETTIPVPAFPPAPAVKEQPEEASTGVKLISDAASSSASDDTKHPGMVPSPMVGVVYLAPEPGSDPFVSVGDKVREGQTLLIVEAMKTMNMIPAPRTGTLLRLLVENGQAVEYGEPLLIIQ